MQLLNVSRSTLQRAQLARTRGIPELFEAIRQDKLAASQSALLAGMSGVQQRQALSRIDDGERTPAHVDSFLFEAPAGRHSEKPAEVRDRITELYPNVARIERFARTAAPGWFAWGKEAAAIEKEDA